MIEPVTIAKGLRRLAAKRNRALGEHGQSIALRRLVSLGFLCCEVVHTPWRIHRNAQGRIVNATPVEKVAGDLRAVAPGGRSVLVEVKARTDRLRFSDLEPHQVAALNAHAQAGGLSLIALVSGGGCAVFDWTRVNLKPGGSLLWAEAELYDLGRQA